MWSNSSSYIFSQVIGEFSLQLEFHSLKLIFMGESGQKSWNAASQICRTIRPFARKNKQFIKILKLRRLWLMRKLWHSDWSVTAVIHYHTACFKLSVGVIRWCRRRQTDGVRRRSVNSSGLTLLLQWAAQMTSERRRIGGWLQQLEVKSCFSVCLL